MTIAENNRVSLTEKTVYVTSTFAPAVLSTPVYLYVPKFYTDVVGISITVLDYLMFSVRIFDAVTVPAIEYTPIEHKHVLANAVPTSQLVQFLWKS